MYCPLLRKGEGAGTEGSNTLTGGEACHKPRLPPVHGSELHIHMQWVCRDWVRGTEAGQSITGMPQLYRLKSTLGQVAVRAHSTCCGHLVVPLATHKGKMLLSAYLSQG